MPRSKQCDNAELDMEESSRRKGRRRKVYEWMNEWMEFRGDEGLMHRLTTAEPARGMHMHRDPPSSCTFPLGLHLSPFLPWALFHASLLWLQFFGASQASVTVPPDSHKSWKSWLRGYFTCLCCWFCCFHFHGAG